MEPFRIHVADDVLDDLRVRLRGTRWPDQVPGIGWKQGTELDWLRRRVSYSEIFDRRAQHSVWLGLFCAESLDSSGSHSISYKLKRLHIEARIVSCCLGLNGSRQPKPSKRALARADFLLRMRSSFFCHFRQFLFASGSDSLN